jgi:hypothetical protein
MRGQPLNENTLHPVLAELPDFTPDPQLWSRIAAAHASTDASATARAPRRSYRLAGLAAAAAAIVIVAIIAGPRAPMQPALVDGQRESQTLETEWRSLTPATQATRPAAGLARLHVIDADLQAAYDRGAEADELQPLWQQRNDALRGLILIAQTDEVTRI